MKFGIGLFTGQKREDTDGWGNTYDEMVSLVEDVETLGFDSAWVSEHHFAEDGYMPGLLPVLGAFATATEEIELGTAMLLAPLHDSVRVAEDAATVSLLASGRLTLGLANGYCEREFENFGVELQERAGRTEEAIKVARNAWSDGQLGFSPRYHSVSSEARITPKPEDAPPIVLGGTSKPAVRRAAMLGDGWNAPELISIEEIQKRVRYQRNLREVENRDDEFKIYIQQYCWVDESKEKAWQKIREPLFYIHRVYESMASGERIDSLSDERKKLVKERTIFGAPSDVRQQIDSYRESIGDDIHVILRTYYPGLGQSMMEECNRRLADEVVPDFS